MFNFYTNVVGTICLNVFDLIFYFKAILYISVEANSEIGRYQVGKTESGR